MPKKMSQTLECAFKTLNFFNNIDCQFTPYLFHLDVTHHDLDQ